MQNMCKTSQRYDLIDMFNDASRYLDDTRYIFNTFQIYPTELQLNKANTSFLDLNIKVIGSATTFDFLLPISPGRVVMILDTNRMVFTYRSWLDLLGVVLASCISVLKIFKSL